jgi:hypothetical protein
MTSVRLIFVLSEEQLIADCVIKEMIEFIVFHGDMIMLSLEVKKDL